MSDTRLSQKLTILLLLTILTIAVLSPQEIVDGIAAIVGDNIILKRTI